ncbi:MAG: glycoside hydrolase family 3 C-terminal domain-containing protein, partial [Clostridia bacterium]|nr:glycoside hydrolase family 3 C-terminal domain-containing protein [Clostridia bacterium]
TLGSIIGKTAHEHTQWIQKWLKDEQGFTGFVVSDWEGAQLIPKSDFRGQIVKAVNAGIDMLMEPDMWRETLEVLKLSVEQGEITQQRIDDAVSRILKVKFENGLFENPTGNINVEPATVRSSNLQVAREAVQKSQVLLKNEGLLPLKKNAKLLVIGQAANDMGVQCGGFTMSWQGSEDISSKKAMEGTTILEGIQAVVEANGGKVYTDPQQAGDADAAILVLGEAPYAEGSGDDSQLSLYNQSALSTNKEAIKKAKATGLPIITILVSGRPRIITNEIKDWNAFIMAWLPGTEGEGVADTLFGDKPYLGTLPFTWPKSIAYFKEKNQADILFHEGFGITTGY